MFFYNKLVQIISSECDSYYDGCNSEAPSVTTIENASELIQTFLSELSSHPSVEQLLKNTAFTDRLKALGWINLAQAEKVSKKATLGTEFFIWDNKGYNSSPRAIDFDKLTAYDAENLAKDTTRLLCTITKGSLNKLNRKIYTKLLEAKERIKTRQEAAKRGAATRAKKAKDKKIAAAKKLLAEADEA